MTIPPPCLFSFLIFHILRPVGLLFLSQDTVNAFSDFLCFLYFLFQCKIPLIEFFLSAVSLVYSSFHAFVGIVVLPFITPLR